MRSLEKPIAINNGFSSIIPKKIPTDFGNVDSYDLVSLYLREVGKTPLLESDEEIALAKLIEQGKDAAMMLERSRILTKNKQTLLERQIADGDEARKYLVAANGQLAVHIAKRYRYQGVPFLDLIQEGNLGLMRAADKFDWRRGNKFSTMATPWVEKAIRNALSNQGRAARQQSNYLDQSVADNHLADTEGVVISQLLRVDMETVMLDVLSAREQRVLERHHGWNGEEPKLFKEIGEELDLSKSRAHQIKDEAMEKLSRRRHLKDYLK